MEIVIPIVSASAISGMGALYAYFQAKKIKNAEAKINIGESQLKKILDECDTQIKYIYKLQILCTEFKQSLSTFHTRQYNNKYNNSNKSGKQQYIIFKNNITYDEYNKINESLQKNYKDDFFSVCDSIKNKNRTLLSEIPNDDLTMFIYSICGLLSWMQIKKKDDSTIHAYTSQNNKLEKLLDEFTNILNINNDRKISIPIILQKNLGNDLICNVADTINSENENENNNSTKNKYNIMDCTDFRRKVNNRYLLLNRANNKIAKYNNDENKNDIMDDVDIIRFDDVIINEENLESNSQTIKSWGMVMATEKYNNWINNKASLLDHLNKGIITQFNDIYKSSKKLQKFFDTNYITSNNVISIMEKYNNNEMFIGFMDGTVKLVNILKNKIIKSIESPYSSLSLFVCSIIVINDNHICFGYASEIFKDYTSVIKIYNIQENRFIKEIERPYTQAFCMIKLSNNKICSTSNEGKNIDIWELDYKDLEIPINIEPFKISSIEDDWDNSNKRINVITQISDNLICFGHGIKKDIFSSFNKSKCIDNFKISIWDLENTTNTIILKGHADTIIKIIKINEDLICSCSDDCTVKIWNIKTGTCDQTFYHENTKPKSIILVQKNFIIASYDDGNISKLNILNHNERLIGINTSDKHSRGITYLLDISNTLDFIYICSSSYDNTLKIWQLRDYNYEVCYKTLLINNDNDDKNNFKEIKNIHNIDYYIEELINLIYITINNYYYKKKWKYKSEINNFIKEIKYSLCKLITNINKKQKIIDIILHEELYNELAKEWILFFNNKIEDYIDIKTHILPYLYKLDKSKFLSDKYDKKYIYCIIYTFYSNNVEPMINDFIEIFKNILYEFLFRNTYKTLYNLDTICSKLIEQTKELLNEDLKKREKLLV